MTDLTRLKVSLTKQGSYRIFETLLDNDREDWLDALNERANNAARGEKIDRPQYMAILAASADANGAVIFPEIWQQAKGSGRETLRQLFFLAQIFSHHQVIDTFKQADHAGQIVRISTDAQDQRDKAFTNLRGNLRELDFVSAEPNRNEFHVDLTGIFDNPDLPPLVLELFRIKLLKANWDEIPDELIDECVEQEFHRVVGLPENMFRHWLGRADAGNLYRQEVHEDMILAAAPEDADQMDIRNFTFQPGHNPGGEELILRAPVQARRVRQAHNRIQNEIYNYLVNIHGPENVGTEQGTGFARASVDVVVRENDGTFTFYEIKTGGSLRDCIRHALSQVLEYAFWPTDARAQTLVIVTAIPVSQDARDYLTNLRERFNLPIYYQSFDSDTGVLSERY